MPWGLRPFEGVNIDHFHVKTTLACTCALRKRFTFWDGM